VAERTTPPGTHPTADAAFAELGRIPLAKASMALVLQKVADLARHVMPGGPAVSVTLIVRDKPETAVFTAPLALDLAAVLADVALLRSAVPCRRPADTPASRLRPRATRVAAPRPSSTGRPR
jgi:hypothetical protein